MDEPRFQWKSRYEEPLLGAIRRNTFRGERVVIVGGGRGVSTVVAARQTGPDGAVITFEGSADQYEQTSKTVSINGVAERCTIKHAIVAEGKGIYGESGDAERILPEEIPEADILILDCEGAEYNILAELEIEPRCVIAETHPNYDSSTEQFCALLDGLGFKTVDVAVDNRVNGNEIVTATRPRQ